MPDGRLVITSTPNKENTITDQTPPAAQPTYQVAAPTLTNGYATAALVLAIAGFFLMGIPLFIGWVLGGIPDILAVIFGIVALNRQAPLNQIGRGKAIAGIIIAGISLLSVLIGAGSIW
jgi:hypothetical protein